eukprot:3443185-Rhodomonas_salina.1
MTAPGARCSVSVVHRIPRGGTESRPHTQSLPPAPPPSRIRSSGTSTSYVRACIAEHACGHRGVPPPA